MIEGDDEEYELAGPSILPLRDGVDYSIEDETEKLLAEDRREMRATRLSPDYLTFDQLLLRRNREIVGPFGAPDRALTKGMYRRSFNPNMGKRPTKLKQGDE